MLQIKNIFNNGSSLVWFHLFKNPDSLQEDDLEDILFIKYKIPFNEPTLSGSEGEFFSNFEFNDLLPDFTYRIVHRAFAPWDWFGDLFGIRNTYNSFQGDNRGFSLLDTELDGMTKARIHHEAIVTLSKGLSANQPLNNIYSSITVGYLNFVRTKRSSKDIYRFEEPIRLERKPVAMQRRFGSPNELQNMARKITHSQFLNMMEFSGTNPLVVPTFATPKIRYRLNLRWMYDSKENKIQILGTVIGKSFPAYEAFVEDLCGNRIFIYTHVSPCESELGKRLGNPDLTTWENFEIIVEVDDSGCFSEQIMYFDSSSNFSGTVTYWNLLNMEKSPAKDCPSIPCEGAYTNDGQDLRNDFDCK